MMAVMVSAGYDPSNDVVPGPNPSTIPGTPLSPFDEPIETVDRESLIAAQPVDGIKYQKAILMVENNCKLRNQFQGTRAFLHLESGYFPELHTKLVTGLPRFKFYELEEDFKNATVDPETLSQAEILTILQNLSKDQHYYDPKGTVTEVLIARETTSEDIVELMKRFNIEKSLDFDLAKRPDIHETSEDRSNGRKFEHDEILKELNPEHVAAVPRAGYDYEYELDKREGLLDLKKNKDEAKKDEL